METSPFEPFFACLPVPFWILQCVSPALPSGTGHCRKSMALKSLPGRVQNGMFLILLQVPELELYRHTWLHLRS